MSIIIAIIIFSFIVVIHEWGHFITAKKSGICVEEFSVGMGLKLISKTFNGTEYSLRAFPLGGFCRMKGENESDEPDSFVNASVLKRILVIAAGPLMNFILAFAVFTVLNFFLVGVSIPVVSETVEGSHAAEVGIQEGDRIIEVNSKKIRVYQDLSLALSQYNGGEINVKVKRNGERLSFDFEPITVDSRTIIGIKAAVKAPVFGDSKGFERVSLTEAAYSGYYQMFSVVKISIKGIGMLITRSVGLDDLGGPVAITGEINSIYNESIQYGIKTVVIDMLMIMGLLSVNIGFMNLLPIPALDGGRLLFLIIELIRGKSVPQEKEAVVHFVGFALIMAFGVVIMINDIMRLIR